MAATSSHDEFRAAMRAAWLQPRVDSDLRSFIAKTRDYTAPEHLGQYIDTLERSTREPVRAVFSAPPRHGKSETTLHFIVQTIRRNPRVRIAYCTYAAEFSEQQAGRALRIAETHGLKFKEQRANFWRTAEGGEIRWVGVGGQITGTGADIFVIDDPVKNRAEAESTVYREATWEWFTSTAFTRLEPKASIVVMATRWHPDDLSGRLIAHGWPRINLPAIDEAGKPLWPERYDATALAEIRELNEYDWWSLYQGEPRSKGGAVFRDVHWYDELPKVAYKISIGSDFAYSKKTHADYSVAVVLASAGGYTFVLDVVRQQVAAPQFAASLRQLRQQYGGARITSFIGGTEKGVVDLMSTREFGGLAIDGIPARDDKFIRAQAVAASWNAGKVLVPSEKFCAASKRSAPWRDAFVSEIVNFTGVGDRHDDQVDALAGAFHPFVPPGQSSKTYANHESRV